MILVLAIVMAVQAQAAARPVDATRVAFSAPRRVLSVAVEELNGSPDRLAWSPDGQQIYLRATRTDRWGNQTVRHYEVRLADGKLRPVEREPSWSGRYWEWKAALMAPGVPDFRVSVESRDERKTATGVDTGGALLGGGSDPTLGAGLGAQGSAIAGIAVQAQMVRTTTFTLKGALLAEFVNTTPVAGLTYGWAPARMDAIVYVSKKSRLIVMDRAGRKREVPSVTDALLPGWSDDGARIAWLQRLGGKRIALVVMDVTAK
jgi:hypothetical protein